MKKLKLVMAYDGTDYFGFQRQPGKRTIQGTLEEALTRLTREPIEIFGSGRTDRGVHALGQVCHFETQSPIPAPKYPLILRRMLPKDILIMSCEEVEPTFHARKSACYKTYRYQIDQGAIPDFLMRRYALHFPYSLHVDKMSEAAKYFVGTHDFTSFCSAKTAVQNRVRTIYRCDVKKRDQFVIIELTGNGFLYNMVRIIAGTLCEVGQGKRSPKEIATILRARNRELAGPTLSPEGLFLVDVGYSPYLTFDNT